MKSVIGVTTHNSFVKDAERFKKKLRLFWRWKKLKKIVSRFVYIEYSTDKPKDHKKWSCIVTPLTLRYNGVKRPGISVKYFRLNVTRWYLKYIFLRFI